MTKAEVLELAGEFTWSYGNEFFIETEEGNFVWSDPDYHGGENTIRKVNYTYVEWCRRSGIPYGRDKGNHFIKDYCGKEIIFIG